MPHQANGSIIRKNEIIIGSELIGQQFSDPRYFWGRPSATPGEAYNAAYSGGANLGPLNPALLDQVSARIAVLRAADPAQAQSVPVDLVTASASGLDPHISLAAAQWQAPSVARLRGLPQEQVQALVAQNTEDRQWGFLGEPRVHVLRLNLALDTVKK